MSKLIFSKPVAGSSLYKAESSIGVFRIWGENHLWFWSLDDSSTVSGCETSYRLAEKACNEHYERFYDTDYKTNRMEILLGAVVQILEKQEKSPYVLSFFEQTAFYDEAECDGYCVFEEIKEILGE